MLDCTPTKVTVSSTSLEKGNLACDTLHFGQRVFALSDLPNCCVVRVNTDDAKLPSLLPVGRHSVGTVKFSGSVADLADETGHAELPWISIPTRHYQPRRLALLRNSRSRRTGPRSSSASVHALRSWHSKLRHPVQHSALDRGFDFLVLDRAGREAYPEYRLVP